MPLTDAQLLEIFPGADPEWADVLNRTFARFNFSSDEAIAGFAGIVGSETGGLSATKREDTRWSAATILRLFPRLGLDQAGAEALARTPAENRANVVYANTIGNGPASSGDGWRYRGGGLIQLTGKSNWQAFYRFLGLPLDTDPDDVMADKQLLADAAGWFLTRHLKPSVIAKLDTGNEADFLEAARKVGIVDDRGRARRLHYWRMAKAVLAEDDAQLTPEPPAAPANPTARVATAGISIGAFWTWISSVIDPADIPNWLGPAQSLVAFIWSNWKAIGLIFALATLGVGLYDFRRYLMQRAASKG